jgi:hypothetical protein
MPPESSLCSYKRACKAYLGIPLESGGRSFWHRENCGRPSEEFLLAKNLTGRQQVYHILHFPRHCQVECQEESIKHPSSYS